MTLFLYILTYSTIIEYFANNVTTSLRTSTNYFLSMCIHKPTYSLRECNVLIADGKWTWMISKWRVKSFSNFFFLISRVCIPVFENVGLLNEGYVLICEWIAHVKKIENIKRKNYLNVPVNDGYHHLKRKKSRKLYIFNEIDWINEAGTS